MVESLENRMGSKTNAITSPLPLPPPLTVSEAKDAIGSNVIHASSSRNQETAVVTAALDPSTID